MKVFLALFVPLLASLLLLPSEVRCRRRVRGEDEYEVSHVRKRALRLRQLFTGINLQKICLLCERHNGINQADCIASKQGAKLRCLHVVKLNRDTYDFQFAELDHPTVVWYPESDEGYFADLYRNKTCKICANISSVNYDDCIADQNQGRDNCRNTMKEMSDRFKNEWKIVPLYEYHWKPVAKRSIGEYFTVSELQKACSICQKYYGIDKANCIAGKEMEIYKCMVKAKEDKAFFESKWTESNSPAAGEDEHRHVKKRSIAVQDESKRENLEKICSICHKYFGIDEASCIKNTQKVTEECKQKVKESQTFLDSKWIKSYSPAAGQPSDVVDFFGTKESIEQMCSICDQLFHFSSSDCVADKTGIRQKCQNWINEYEKLIKHTENQQIVAPRSVESDSAALKFSNADN